LDEGLLQRVTGKEASLGFVHTQAARLSIRL